MNFDIIFPDGSIQSVQITADVFKALNVWNIQIAGQLKAVIYNVGGLWLQRNEDCLQQEVLKSIGTLIENISIGNV